MSVTVEAIIGNATYALSGRNPYAFISLTGLGLPPVRRSKERGPQQHGSTDVGFLLDERMLNLALLVVGDTLAEMDDHRDVLAEILKPLESTPIKLRVTRDNGSVRQIDCHVAGMVDFPNTLDLRMGASQQVIVQLEAADPIPYDPALQNIVFTVASGSAPPGGFMVPLHIPMRYTAGGSIDAVENLVYAGKWEAFPKIFLSGPATNAQIINLTTGAKLDFAGHSIGAGDVYEIDLRYGYKSVRDSSGTLQNAALTDESDLVTWRLVPTPLAPGGINNIRVVVPAGATAATKVRVEYYNRYPSF